MSTLISYSHLPLFLPVQDGQYRLMFLVPRLAGGPAGHRLAPQHHLREPLRPRLPPHHLPRPGPTLWSTPGGGKPGPNLRQQHEARQASVLRSVPSDRDQRWKGLQRERAFRTVHVFFMWRYPEMIGPQRSEELYSNLRNKKGPEGPENGFRSFC